MPPRTSKQRTAKGGNAEPQVEASMSQPSGAHAAAQRRKREAKPKIEIDSELLAHAHVSKAWPFEEARKVLSRLKRIPKPTGAIIFETGYGPSGLPHIGTFGEVARTTMVRHAFRVLTEDKIPTRLICFSDDMDGLRKVPDNVPNKEMLAEHLGKPLTQVPDPFGDHPSFGHHNNARLRAFLDTFGFDYEFLSATECYTSGRFDETLLKVLENYDAIRDVILPTLGPERRATYSPFLPISPLYRPSAASADRRSRRGRRHDHSTRIPIPASSPRSRSRAAIASCNGRPIGRCAGRRSASTTRWPART